MMNIYELMKSGDIILEGHFILTSGRHSDVYINKDAIYKKHHIFTTVVSEMCAKIAQCGLNIDVISGPAIAGAVLAAPISLNLNKSFVYPEKVCEIEQDKNGESRITSTQMVFRRGYDKDLINKRVFLIEDIITTGGSVQKTATAIKENGGHVSGVISIWNKTNWKLSDCLNLTLINKPVDSWTPEECPLCEKKVHLRDPKIFQ